jgi:hypothetical protein
MTTLRDSITNMIADGEVLHAFVRGGADVSIPVEGGTIPSLANLAKNIADNITASLTAISTSSITTRLSDLIFSVPLGKAFQSGQWVTISNGDGVVMAGVVLSYINNVLRVRVSNISGFGTFSNWLIYVSGMPGKQGNDGQNIPTPAEPSGPQSTLITKLPWEI